MKIHLKICELIMIKITFKKSYLKNKLYTKYNIHYLLNIQKMFYFVGYEKFMQRQIIV